MVALTFDNNDKYLHSDFNEVEIKRIVYSTGENEYYINNSRVRLKDITDLLSIREQVLVLLILYLKVM